MKIDPAMSPDSDAYEVPGTGIYPEGLAHDAQTDMLFTTSMLTGAVFRAQAGRASFQSFSAAGADGRVSSTGIKVDPERRRLFVCGGVTGAVWVREVESGALIGRFTNGLVDGPPKTSAPNAEVPSFVNDVALVGSDAYFTDSYEPMIYRLIDADITAGGINAGGRLEPWLPLDGTPIRYQNGASVPTRFNLNGIVATQDGRFLIVIQTNTGNLYRVDVVSREVIEIAGSGNPGGDGLMAIDQHHLLAVDMTHAPTMTLLRLSDEYDQYEVVGRYDAPGNVSPTASLVLADRLLLTESQISDVLLTQRPEHLPFRVTVHPLAMIAPAI